RRRRHHHGRARDRGRDGRACLRRKRRRWPWQRPRADTRRWRACRTRRNLRKGKRPFGIWMTGPIDFYLKPGGLLTGAAAAKACAEGMAARLAGGPIAFSAAELIRRNGVERDTALHGVRALRSCRLRDDVDLSAAIEQRLGAITAARTPFAGLALDRPRIMG